MLMDLVLATWTYYRSIPQAKVLTMSTIATNTAIMHNAILAIKDLTLRDNTH